MSRKAKNCRDPKPIKILSEVAPGKTDIAAASIESQPAMVLEPKPEKPEKPETAAQSDHPGLQTYSQYCSICHASGVAGAPKPGGTNNREVLAIEIDTSLGTPLYKPCAGATERTATTRCIGWTAALRLGNQRPEKRQF